MTEVYSSLESAPRAIKEWPAPGSRAEDAIFACAAVMFVEPVRSDAARRALIRTLGRREFEFFSGCLAFIRTAHYWTIRSYGLFEPFVQQEVSRDRSTGGLGLGLTISSRLARLQNCSLTAASPGTGRGALFTLTIPMAGCSTGHGLDGGSKEKSRPRSLLSVEDNEDLAEGIAELLRLHGVFVRVAYAGPSAIKSALDNVPDVILCDLGLPGGMDGFAVARACRAEESLRAVHLVAASGYSSLRALIR